MAAIQPETSATLPKLLLAQAARWGARRVAIREKEFGIWQAHSWQDYAAHVERIALGLAGLRFRRGDKIAVIGDNRPQLYWTMLAAQALGGVPVPVYQDSIAAEMHYVIDHSESRMIICEDQEQVDKILEMKDKLPLVEVIIYDDPKGMRHYEYPFLLSLEQVQEMGATFAVNHPGLWAAEVGKGKPGDLAIINYTSGTTGFPKGVMISHGALIATARSFLAVEPLDERDEVMAYLPMAWIGDSFFSVAVAFLSGCTVNCPEDASTVRHDFREIGPTMTFAPPRIWENILSQSQVRIEDANWLQRTLTNFFLPRGMLKAKLELEAKPVPAGLRVLCGVGRWLVFEPLRDQLGFRRIRSAITGGAALGPEMMQFFRALGVNLKQLYGATECCAPATLHRDGQVKLETVGAPLPGVDVKLSLEGEVLIRCGGLFSGYYKSPEQTAAALRDGWLHTGDAGLFDPDGHLVIIDRVKDVAKLDDGAVFAPQYIENKLKFSVYVKEAVAVGNQRSYVAAMVNIDMDVLASWAERRGLAYTGYTDLAQNPATYQLVHDEIQRTNEALVPSQRVKRFAILHKELDPDDAEITRTRKLRRGFINERYASIIAALYDSRAATIAVRATVTYEDGRTSETERQVRIMDVEGA
ncbi:MAG TPA: AMP-binding protein [Methylomirabilota bacterium]